MKPYSLIVCLVIIILLGNFVFVLNGSFHRAEIDKLGLNESIVIGTISYLTSGERLPEVYTENEVAHLLDVKNLFYKVKLAYYLSIAALIAFTLFYVQKQEFYAKIIPSFIISGIVSLAIIGILMVAMLNFSSTFNLLHQPFFSEGSWVFPEDSVIIKTFPEIYFKDFSAHYLRTVFINAALFFGIGMYLRRKRKTIDTDKS